MAKVRLGGASGSIRPAGMESSGTRSLATLAQGRFILLCAALFMFCSEEAKH